MPAGFETPYPAWMARYTEEAGPFVMAYFGAQQHSLLPPDALAPINAMLARGPVPGHVLRARCHDQAGYDTRAAIAYWPDPAAFSAWRRESGFDAWWADPARESGPVGWFVEAVTPPADRLEVLYSTPDGIEGAGHLQAHLSEQPVAEHAYWGSARDRIPASQTEALAGPQGGLAASREGARVRVAPRENLCMIRSGQNWSRTEGHERSIYMEKVRPKLIAGMAFLRDRGREIGCCSCRFMEVIDDRGAPTEKTFGHAFFATLADMEAWAKDHPTHLAIFGTFMSLLQALLSGSICILLIMNSTTKASAQEIEPYDFVPLSAGTNLAIGYYVYGHNTEYNIARGGTIKDSGLEVNVGVARYVHYVDIAGHPAGFQIIQPFGSESAAHIDGQRVGSAFGAQNIQLSAFIWPYVNTATKTNVNLTGFIYPPTGTYDRRSPINVGDNRWRGDVQLGLSQGITDNLAVDVSFDTQFYGDNSDYFPGNRRLSQDPTYRAQVWANWRWSPAFTTSIGYEGFFGGSQQVNGFFDGSKTEEQRLRAAAALFLTPHLQTLLELNHDVKAVGGFKQDFGTTLRVVYVF